MMTETQVKNTQGPWELVGSYRIKWEDGRIVVRTDYEHNDENDSNARLIAAAPELLEACKTVADEMQVAESSGESRSGIWFARRIRILRNAIAKAES